MRPGRRYGRGATCAVVAFAAADERGNVHGAKYPGTGMGLALSKRVVQRLGGEIWHEPATSGGSIYHFTIPDKEMTNDAR